MPDRIYSPINPYDRGTDEHLEYADEAREQRERVEEGEKGEE